MWKACNNTAIKDGSNNLYYLNQATDSEWLKAADWGDVAQQGSITQSAFFDNLGKTISTLEYSTFNVSGTATAGSNVITGIASTANIKVGQAAIAYNYTSQGTVTAVASDSVTLSVAAVGSGTATLTLETLGTCHSTGGAALNSNSLATANCRSRYGVADHVGNVWEWTPGQIYTGYGYDNGVDGLWLGRAFPTANNNISTLGKYDLLRGIPTTSSAATVQANGDYYWYAAGLMGSFRGGLWNSGAGAGRWTLELDGAPGASFTRLGGRCVR
jgi:hypothetical protein